MNVRNLISKNLVILVMVPALVGAHYGWYKLQAVETLVPLEDRKNIPKWLRPGDKD